MMQSNQPYQSADQGISWGSIGGLAAIAGAGYLGFKHRKKIGGWLGKGKETVKNTAHKVSGGRVGSEAVSSSRESIIHHYENAKPKYNADEARAYYSKGNAASEAKAATSGPVAETTLFQNEYGTVSVGPNAPQRKKRKLN